MLGVGPHGGRRTTPATMIDRCKKSHQAETSPPVPISPFAPLPPPRILQHDVSNWRMRRSDKFGVEAAETMAQKPAAMVGGCVFTSYLPNKSTCHNNAQCLSTHHDLNGQQRPPWCPTPGTAADNSCPENWLIVVCGGARSEAPWYGGKMASMMDTCSKPVCLTSWKKRSRDLSLSDHGFMQ